MISLVKNPMLKTKQLSTLDGREAVALCHKKGR